MQSKPNEALQDLNTARTDPKLAASATYLMVDTYLTPINDALWSNEEVDKQNVSQAVSACQQLLNALPAADRDTNKYASCSTRLLFSPFAFAFLSFRTLKWSGGISMHGW